MLSRSVNILFYFCLVIQNVVVQIVVKGTPGEGHPLKEGLRLGVAVLFTAQGLAPERVIH